MLLTKRPCTYETYESIIRIHVKPAPGAIRLQQLKATDLQHYYTDKGAELSQTTLERHHTLISSALKAAEMQDMVPRNVARLVPGKPRAKDGTDDVLNNCWEVGEARKFIAAAKKHGPRQRLSTPWLWILVRGKASCAGSSRSISILVPVLSQ